jgi:T4 gene Gp59 loader of gp41 DNA helicase
MLAFNIMEGFDAYKTYVALKNHFTRASYDYFKYNGHTKVSREKFETRNDKYFFAKLSKHKDFDKFLIANFIDGDFSYVVDMVSNSESEKIYRAWLGRQESITYTFTDDLDRMMPSFNDNVAVLKGQHPHLLKMYMRKEVCPETMVVLNDLCGIFKYWSKHIEEDIIWPQIHSRLIKYAPFVKFDRTKMKAIVLSKFDSDVD